MGIILHLIKPVSEKKPQQFIQYWLLRQLFALENQCKQTGLFVLIILLFPMYTIKKVFIIFNNFI